MPQRWVSEDSARLSFAVPSNRSKGHKLKHKKFHLNVRKNSFMLKVAEDWNSCPDRSPCLETFKTQPSSVTCSRWPCLESGIGLDDLQMSLPTLTMLWSCDLQLSSQHTAGTPELTVGSHSISIIYIRAAEVPPCCLQCAFPNVF